MLELSRRMMLMTAVATIASAATQHVTLATGSDPLPSWREGEAKARIVAFVTETTTMGGENFVVASDRIAVFDNDGTLWSEKPFYFQAFFALDRIRALAPSHPEWNDKEPFKSIIAGDLESFAAQGEHAILEVIMETHAGLSVDAFKEIVSDWLVDAKHPTLGRNFDSLVFQPMLELLTYLRANGYETWIVSGGGIEFIRTFAERAYGIPPQQVIGSSVVTEFQIVDGKPELMRLPKVDFIDDKAGKPVGINKFIGKRPVFAAGNSDGDMQMLQWTTAGEGPRFGLIVHHTDDAREFSYDRQSSVGRLDKALDLAPSEGWLVVDMKSDWATIFP
jgi:phosphoglycolate phosphatase-like HAD superfamily hydrolase